MKNPGHKGVRDMPVKRTLHNKGRRDDRSHSMG